MKRFLVLLTFLLTGSFPAFAAPTVQVDRSVVIHGVIAKGNVLPLGEQLLAWSRTQPKRPVDVIIDSPGGDVVTGFLFVNQLEAVRQRGTPVRCFVPTIAASMAFQILLHCDERYTLDHAWLLWHGVRVFANGLVITEEAAAQLQTELARLNGTILQELRNTLGRDLSAAVIQYHFQAETLHVGRDLATLAPRFVTSLRSIPGLYDALKSSPRSEEPSMFGDTFAPGQIVHIAPACDVAGGCPALAPDWQSLVAP